MLQESNTSDEFYFVNTCWLCQGRGQGKQWINPCICTGATEWIHHECLLKWVDQLLQENPNVTVGCPHCWVTYGVEDTGLGLWNSFWDGMYKLEKFVHQNVVRAIFGPILFSILFLFTFLIMSRLIFGYKDICNPEGLRVIFPCISIPILSHVMIYLVREPWEESLLSTLHWLSDKYSMLEFSLPNGPRPGQDDYKDFKRDSVSEASKWKLQIFSFMLHPTVIILSSFPNYTIMILIKCLLVGVFFMLVNGIIYMYKKQKLINMFNNQIVELNEENE